MEKMKLKSECKVSVDLSGELAANFSQNSLTSGSSGEQ